MTTIPTAADYLAEAAELQVDIARAESATEQVKLRGLVNTFDYNEPLPDLRIRRGRSWEPAARRYKDLEEGER